MDQKKLDAFLGQVVTDVGAAFSAALVVIGDRLGLYKAMAGAGPLTPEALAKRVSCSPRYVREWLDNQAAGGYVTYDPASGAYTLPPEQAAALADERSPAFMSGAFAIVQAGFAGIPTIEDRFRTGQGLEWGEQAPCLFEGTERFFRSAYIGNLVDAWLPSLEGIVPKLKAGAKVADVGCGHGSSTLLMAEAFPKSTFHGFDYHEGSITTARQRARASGLDGRASFAVGGATDYEGSGYDLVAHFDCLHDLADPVGAGRRVRETLAPGGVWMIVEPKAGDRPEENHNPVGRVYYAASTMLCVPCSLARKGKALGAQAGAKRIRAVAEEAGFRHFREATSTPFNSVYEARV
jgi:ubiquinone/menaquinone biosynthesis C-methylase UbiE